MKKYKKYNSIISIFAIIAMIAMNLGLISNVEAAQLTSLKDTLSTVKASTVANHTIQFVTPTGVAASGTITVVFPTGFLMNTVDFADMDLAKAATCTSFADEVLAATPTGATWGAALASQTITFTNGSAAITAGWCVQIEVGTNATSVAQGDTQVTNPAAANDLKMTITAGASDSASLAISIITDDVVAVTANVDPTLTFTIGDVAIGFGTLSSTAARWASADANGSASDVTAHNLTIATNAATGYAITYNGATLTNGSHTIDAITAGIADNADGNPATEEFGISFAKVGGDATIASGYDHITSPDWKFVASTTTTVVSETTETTTETISAYYLANISTITEPGSYSTAITYIATGIF